jgi:predicted kinase
MTEKKSDCPIKIKEEKLCYNEVQTQIKFLQGKILTVIDASYNDKEQRKAVKDLINNFFSYQLNWIYDISHPNIETLNEHQVISLDEIKVKE